MIGRGVIFRLFQHKFHLYCFIFLTSHLFASQSPVDNTECVAFVCDKNYFPKFLRTLELLTTKGNYHGNICLVIGDDLLESELLNNPLVKNNHVIVKHFPDLSWNLEFLSAAKQLPHSAKLFRYHKLYLFHPYFKQWQTVFYIDCGMEIFSDIHPMLEVKQPNTLLANSDTYPDYVWKLHDQFDQKFSSYYQELCEKFNLNIDYFQTTMMLYDTSIIEEHTFDHLCDLARRYPISTTHDQGIIALYFTNVMPVWKQIPFRNKKTYFYDFCRRGRKKAKFIMIKYTNLP